MAGPRRSFRTILCWVGAEILYKPAQWPVRGVDIHRIRKRDYDMRFDLLDYETTVGHLSFTAMRAEC